MRINIQKLRDHGFKVEVHQDDIIIQPDVSSGDHGSLWQRLHDVISPNLDEIHTEIVLQETVGNIQKHQIVSLFDL